jgi:hypothetical protein
MALNVRVSLAYILEGAEYILDIPFLFDMRNISLSITDYLALRVLLNAMLKISTISSLISVMDTPKALTRISRVSRASNGHGEALNYCEHV